MDEKLKSHILAVLETLNGIEVKGVDNMQKLLGSMQHLQKLLNGELGIYVQKDDSES